MKRHLLAHVALVDRSDKVIVKSKKNIILSRRFSLKRYKTDHGVQLQSVKKLLKYKIKTLSSTSTAVLKFLKLIVKVERGKQNKKSFDKRSQQKTTSRLANSFTKALPHVLMGGKFI